jgi:hypothetical protein
MQRLTIDFVRAGAGSRWAGWLLLAVSLALAVEALASYAQLRRALAGDEARLARATQGDNRRAAGRLAAEDLAAARESIQRLTLPWATLFAALEGAASERVALLAIEPDPRSGKVTLSGESKDYLAALTYVLNLRQAEGLAEVQLVRHEEKSKDPQRPVHFSVSASWAR